MHVIVVGCGRVGSEVALNLAGSEHDVVVIDRRLESFRRLGDGFKGTTMVGVGFDRDVLTEAGITPNCSVAAVTSGDNSNILIARVARETFGVKHVVARIYDPRRALIYQRLGIPTVATVAWTTDQVLRRLLPGEMSHDWVDPTGRIGLVERTIPAKAIGQKLAKLNRPGRFWLTAVTRFGKAQVVTAELIGQEGDVLVFVSDMDALEELQKHIESGGSD